MTNGQYPGHPSGAGEIRHLQFLKFPLRFQTNKKGIPIKEIPFSLYIIPIKEIPFSLYIYIYNSNGDVSNSNGDVSNSNGNVFPTQHCDETPE